MPDPFSCIRIICAKIINKIETMSHIGAVEAFFPHQMNSSDSLSAPPLSESTPSRLPFSFIRISSKESKLDVASFDACALSDVVKQAAEFSI